VTTSKSPKAVALAALAAARRGLPAYAHKNSPKKFTQHQLFACLVLKNFWCTDYRGAVAQLEDNPFLVQVLALPEIPHFTTLQKASRRILGSAVAKRLLKATVREQFGRKRRIRVGAVDSTGLESSCASGYFVRRRAAIESAWKTVTYSRYPQLSVVCDVQTHFILAYRDGRGPRADVTDFRPLLADALAHVRIAVMLGDAGFDSERNHAFAREEHGVRSIIPPRRGRPSHKPAGGRYRRLMETRFDGDTYAQRAQVETVVSMIKRRQGAHVRGLNYWSQCRDLRLKVLTHNVMILVTLRLFYRAVLTCSVENLGTLAKPRCCKHP
jgi:hypothetical protein